MRLIHAILVHASQCAARLGAYAQAAAMHAPPKPPKIIPCTRIGMKLGFSLAQAPTVPAEHHLLTQNSHDSHASAELAHKIPLMVKKMLRTELAKARM